MRRYIFVVLLIGIGTASGLACAQAVMRTAPAQRPETAQDIERQGATTAAESAATEGPATIALLDQAELALPPGSAYVPAPQAARFLRAYAPDTDRQNDTHPNLVGLVGFADAGRDGGVVLIRYVGEGHIEDASAATWDTDELLAKIRAKVAAHNGTRDASKLDVLGWVEAPAYDAVRRHLVSSLLTRRERRVEDAEPHLDYDAYALGRDGYFQLKLLAPPSLLAAQRPMIDGLLDALRYRPGKRYQDFDGTTDRPARYRLDALVGGGLLKEPSLTNLFFAYLEMVGRPAIALIVLGVWVVRWFRRKAKPAASLSAS